MAAPDVQIIGSFKEYVAFIEDLKAPLDAPLWFRGCGDCSHELIPSLYRHKFTKNIEGFMKLEESLLQRFRQRSVPFNSRELRDNWEWLFLMQHYGIPTRLLDWSENPLTALFFAITSAPHKLTAKGKLSFQKDAAVWILQPNEWNKKSIDLSSFKGKILSTNDENLLAYAPVGDCRLMKDFPIAVFGTHNSRRIVAQRGVFVVFGKNATPMEKMFDVNGFPSGSLKKLIFKATSLPQLHDAVLRNGITDSVVFPDLDGLAREIKRQFDFGV